MPKNGKLSVCGGEVLSSPVSDWSTISPFSGPNGKRLPVQMINENNELKHTPPGAFVKGLREPLSVCPLLGNTVEPLIKATPEMRPPLYKGHFARSQMCILIQINP